MKSSTIVIISLVLILCPVQYVMANSSDELVHCLKSIPSDTTPKAAGEMQLICQAEANLKLISKRSTYDLWSLERRKSILDWQHISSIVIFSLVVIILVSGLAFAFLEFRKGKGGGDKTQNGR